MKKYDFEKAKQLIIENADNLESASLGMHEDWFWTAEEVWENGKFTQELNNETMIGGINGSRWATPAIKLSFKDGTEKMIECSDGENTETKPSFLLLGALSQPVQDNITPLTE
jgi:hypothetical protein